MYNYISDEFRMDMMGMVDSLANPITSLIVRMDMIEKSQIPNNLICIIKNKDTLRLVSKDIGEKFKKSYYIENLLMGEGDVLYYVRQIEGKPITYYKIAVIQNQCIDCNSRSCNCVITAFLK